MPPKRHGFTIIEYSIIPLGLLFAVHATYAGLR